MHPLIEQNREAVAALCRRYGVRTLDVFGSVLRNDFSEASDVDVVARFGPPVDTDRVHQYFDFKTKLSELLGRPVDVVELDAMQDSRLKRVIEKSHVNIYAAAA